MDLVIKNEKDMDDLLKVVVHAMDTVDGNKNSAHAIKKAILEAKIQQQFEKDTTQDIEKIKSGVYLTTTENNKIY